MTLQINLIAIPIAKIFLLPLKLHIVQCSYIVHVGPDDDYEDFWVSHIKIFIFFPATQVNLLKVT